MTSPTRIELAGTGRSIETSLRLGCRPGERLARRETLERIVRRVRARAREADVEVERVRVAVCGERAEARRAEPGQRAAVHRRARVVGVFVDLQLQLSCQSRAPAVRAGQRVATGKRPG